MTSRTRVDVGRTVVGATCPTRVAVGVAVGTPPDAGTVGVRVGVLVGVEVGPLPAMGSVDVGAPVPEWTSA
jgi:hypothetical protein